MDDACIIAQCFENAHHIPQIRGYRWNNILVLLHSDGYRNLINQKERLSYTVQAVVDKRYREDSALNHNQCRLIIIDTIKLKFLMSKCLLVEEFTSV